jgi:hypothetical protein
MRRVLAVTATTAVGIALLSCTAPQPSAVHSPTATAMVNEPLAPIVRAPLLPPVGYASPPPLTNSPTPLEPYATSPNQGTESQTAADGVWRASPRWAAVKGENCIVVEQDPQAAKVRVENCSKEAADDLTPARPEEPSGY